MNNIVRSKVVKIGNSRGIRIPRALLEQAGLTNEVEMSVEGDKTRLVRKLGEIDQGTQKKVLAVLAELFAE